MQFLSETSPEILQAKAGSPASSQVRLLDEKAGLRNTDLGNSKDGNFEDNCSTTSRFFGKALCSRFHKKKRRYA